MTAHSPAPVAADARPLVLMKIPDGEGGFIHDWRPAPEQTGRKRKERPAPDPIHANPEEAAQQLAQFVERLERLHEERAVITSDIGDVMAEAKAQGYDKKAIAGILQMRKMDPGLRAEAEAILETYKTALGIV